LQKRHRNHSAARPQKTVNNTYSQPRARRKHAFLFKKLHNITECIFSCIALFNAYFQLFYTLDNTIRVYLKQAYLPAENGG